MAKCRYCKKEAKTAGMCSTHYQYVWYWHNEGIGRTMKHRDKLHLRQQILDDSAGSQNVVPIKRRRAA